MNKNFYETFCASDAAWLYTWDDLLDGGSGQRVNRNKAKAQQISLEAVRCMSDKCDKDKKNIFVSDLLDGGMHGYG